MNKILIVFLTCQSCNSTEFEEKIQKKLSFFQYKLANVLLNLHNDQNRLTNLEESFKCFENTIESQNTKINYLKTNNTLLQTKLQNAENNIKELREDLRSARDDFREAKKKSKWNKVLVVSSCILVAFLLFFVVRIYYQLFFT